MGGRAVEGYVFAGVDGRPTHADRFSKVFRMRVREPRSRHPLSRPAHAHAQHLADAGAHPKAISEGSVTRASRSPSTPTPIPRSACRGKQWRRSAGPCGTRMRVPVSACERLPDRRLRPHVSDNLSPATIRPGGGSSVGQSSGLIIRRSQVRVLPAPPQSAGKGPREHLGATWAKGLYRACTAGG
jgi:hypothetical protein